MQKNNVNRLVWLTILAIIMVVAPFTISGYKVDSLTMLMVNVILAVSFRLITTTGGWSLAHVPMMGAGAYATALISGKLGIPFWFSMPLAGLAAGLTGLAISYPLVRTKTFLFSWRHLRQVKLLGFVGLGLRSLSEATEDWASLSLNLFPVYPHWISLRPFLTIF